ncbi:MAG: helix-turn-helix domain-containing protein [Planctomycetota bacterium]
MIPNPVNQSLMTLKGICDYLKVTRYTVYRLIKDGQLPAIRVGGQWRFRPDEVQRYLDSKQSRYGTISVNQYYFFRYDVLDKYRKDSAKYYIKDEAYQGLVGSKKDYCSVRTMGRKNLPDGVKVFYDLRYRKIVTKEKLATLAVNHKDYDQLPREEYDHWSSFRMKNRR